MNISGQGHSLTLVQGHSDSSFSNIFSWETAMPIKPNFMWSLSGIGERKFVQMVQVTWPRWPPCPYMVETWKIIVLWNQKADDLESLYAASSAQVLPSLFKWWPWLTLTCFTTRSNFVSYGFVWEKVNGFFRNCCSLWYIKVGICSQLNEYTKLYVYQRSRSLIVLGPDLSDSIFLNFS